MSLKFVTRIVTKFSLKKKIDTKNPFDTMDLLKRKFVDKLTPGTPINDIARL